MHITSTILRTNTEIQFVTTITDSEYIEYCYNDQYLNDIVNSWFSNILTINLIELYHNQALFQVFFKLK